MKSEKGFVKLDSVVHELLAQLRETTLHRYVWLLNYLLISYRKHLYSTIPVTKTCTIQVGTTKTAKYPDDYIGLIKIGVQNGDRIVKLFEDPSINRIDANDVKYSPSELQDRRYSYAYFNRSHDFEAEKFKGMGIDTNGSYKNNLGKQCFEFAVDSKVNIGDTLVIEYVSNGWNPDTDTLIYLPAAEMLKAHALYQYYLFNLGGQSGKTESWRIVYLREKAEYLAITSNLGGDEILAALARTASVAPRY